MKVKRPAETIKVCDFCRRPERFLTECWSCGKEYCLTCDATIAGSYGFHRLCKQCGERDDVQRVCNQYASKLQKIFKQRDDTLRQLKEQPQ